MISETNIVIICIVILAFLFMVLWIVNRIELKEKREENLELKQVIGTKNKEIARLTGVLSKVKETTRETKEMIKEVKEKIRRRCDEESI